MTLNNKQLTVSQLIEELKQFPPDELIFSQGCSCPDNHEILGVSKKENELFIEIQK